MLIVEISEISSPSLFRWELRGVRGGRTEGRVARRNATRPQRQRAAGFSCAQPSTARRGTPILQLTMLRFRGPSGRPEVRATGFGRRLVRLQRPRSSHATGGCGTPGCRQCLRFLPLDPSASIVLRAWFCFLRKCTSDVKEVWISAP